MKKKTNLLNFLKRNAFYFVLAFCVLGAGVATYFSVSGTKEKEKEESGLVQEIVETPQKNIKTETKEQVEHTKAPEKENVEELADETSANADTNKEVTLQKPLEGKITRGFSGEKFFYNRTLNMWTTHNGIDIDASEHTLIVAALEGEVAEVYQDESMGLCIKLKHNSEQVTLYAGLAKAQVEIGDHVTAGQEIGTCGTPTFEKDTGAHLHFEYLVGGTYQDPVKVMK